MANELKPWKYDIQYGPEGEANYAWVYDDLGDMIATMKIHKAKEIVERMNTRPAAPVEGLETYMRADFGTVDLVTRSQAEAIIAAERAESDEAYELGKRDGYSEAVQEIDLKTGGDGEYRYCTDHDPERHTPYPASMIQRIVERFETLNTMESVSEINEWKERAEKAEADNAALTATIERLRDSSEPMACDPDEWTATEEVLSHILINVIGVPDDVTYTPNEAQQIIERQLKKTEAVETQLTAAKDALEIVANAHASNPSLAMADVPEADYVRHVLYEMRKLARAALEAKP